MVEGVGQFSLRGGILDVFSPAQDAPIRCEFFGDTLDAMGYFDTVTQRRTEVLEQAVLLPASEVQPRLHPEGLPGLVADLQALIARQKRRKKPHAPLIATLERDLERLENGVSFPAADRYCGLIYPEFACAADYLSKDACVVFCDHGRRGPCGRGCTGEYGTHAGRHAGERPGLRRAVRILSGLGRPVPESGGPVRAVSGQLPLRQISGRPAAQASCYL